MQLRRGEQLGGATRPSTTIPRDGHSGAATVDWSPDVPDAACTAREGAEERLHRQHKAPPDRSINAGVYASRGAHCVETRSGDSCGSERALGRALTGVSLFQALAGCAPRRQGESLRQRRREATARSAISLGLGDGLPNPLHPPPLTEKKTNPQGGERGEEGGRRANPNPKLVTSVEGRRGVAPLSPPPLPPTSLSPLSIPPSPKPQKGGSCGRSLPTKSLDLT